MIRIFSKNALLTFLLDWHVPNKVLHQVTNNPLSKWDQVTNFPLLKWDIINVEFMVSSSPNSENHSWAHTNVAITVASSNKEITKQPTYWYLVEAAQGKNFRPHLLSNHDGNHTLTYSQWIHAHDGKHGGTHGIIIGGSTSRKKKERERWRTI